MVTDKSQTVLLELSPRQAKAVHDYLDLWFFHLRGDMFELPGSKTAQKTVREAQLVGEFLAGVADAIEGRRSKYWAELERITGSSHRGAYGQGTLVF